MVRLHKYLAECGICSRRAAEELIREGKVRVNGQLIAEQGRIVDPLHDQVTVRGKIIKAPLKGVLLLHKPRGIVSTLADPQGRRTVADYLTKHYKSYFPVGRLDIESQGLMILTNDGDLANHLLHPRFGAARVYHARISGTINARTIAKLKRGVKLEDGVARVEEISVISNQDDYCWVEVTVREGRNRLVRRVFEKVFHPVNKLKRISHGPFTLGRLRPGQVRHLDEREYKLLREKVLGREQRKSKAPRERSNRAAFTESEPLPE
jgi:23S rRNA pseudouridine2605 synthase